MKNIIICGAPGSGKGTQSELIIKKYNLKHISTGDLLRKEIADETDLGKDAHKYIRIGQLVPDELITGMIAHKLDSLDKNEVNGIILDGFPRTLAQAEALESMLQERGEKTDVLVDLEVEEEELINRLLFRGKTSGRSDDNLETIQKRLQVYHAQTKPVSEFYKSKGKYASIYGMGSVEEIFERIANILD
ncbi:MAG: adenylate kinase [Paludibacteraceae bacterium]